MWQPIGVVAASALAYGTAARYRCDVKLPACSAVASGEACCTVASNMGWRYLVVVIGSMTLVIFFARFAIFKFYESPKFLLSKGREHEAIDVLHKIALFNKAPPPTLTVEDFRQIDIDAGIDEQESAAKGHGAKDVVLRAIQGMGFLKELFGKRRQCLAFLVLAIAYMV